MQNISPCWTKLVSIVSVASDRRMIVTNLILCVAVITYFAWLCLRVRFLLKQTISSNSAAEILRVVLAKRRFYLRQAVISFIFLAILMAIKAVFVLAGKFSDGALTRIVFGTTTNENFFAMVGWLGVLIIFVSAICWYQHLKSSHHLQVLFAFRKQLGLAELGN